MGTIWERLVSDSKRAKAWFVETSPMMGFLKAIHTIMMLKICSEFPDMYIIIAVMGNDFTGARATSHAFLTLSVSISAGVWGCRWWVLASFDDFSFCI